MPVRIYDIAKKLGIESKEVLVKAKELGITTAKVPSSSLDKITAEYLETHLKPAIPAAPEPAPTPPPAPEPIRIVSAPPEAVTPSPEILGSPTAEVAPPTPPVTEEAEAKTPPPPAEPPPPVG